MKKLAFIKIDGILNMRWIEKNIQKETDHEKLQVILNKEKEGLKKDKKFTKIQSSKYYSRKYKSEICNTLFLINYFCFINYLNNIILYIIKNN